MEFELTTELYKKYFYEVIKYTPKNSVHRDLFSSMENLNPLQDEVPFYFINGVGQFALITRMSKDLPLTDVFVKKQKAKVHKFGSYFQITDEDFDYDDNKKVIVKTENGQHNKDTWVATESRIVWYGKKENNIYGLGNHPNMIKVVLRDGAKGKGSWSDKTGKEIATDLSDIVHSVKHLDDSEGDGLIVFMSTKPYTKATRTSVNDKDDKTAMQLFLERNPKVINVIEISHLNPKYTDRNGGLVVAVNIDKKKVELATPEDFRMKKPQPAMHDYNVPTKGRTAGLIFKKPTSAAYAEVI